MSEKNENIPKRRFKEFQNAPAWEQRELSEIFNILDGDRGKNYPGENDFYTIGHTLFLDTGNVKKTGFNFTNTKYITKEKNEMLRNGKLEVHDFVITSRGTLGNLAYYDQKIHEKYPAIRVNSAMLILRPILREVISDNFMAAILRGQIIQRFMAKSHVGSAQPHITKRDFSKTKILLPNTVKEQERVGKLILEIDNLITLHQRKGMYIYTLCELRYLKRGGKWEWFLVLIKIMLKIYFKIGL